MWSTRVLHASFQRGCSKVLGKAGVTLVKELVRTTMEGDSSFSATGLLYAVKEAGGSVVRSVCGTTSTGMREGVGS